MSDEVAVSAKPRL